jgi:hypothetical protein
LLGAVLGSLAAAGIILVTVVLPAEYDLDPLGTGEWLGLTGLARATPSVVTPQTAPYRDDRVRFELEPFESVEYKYRFEKGDAMVFSWLSSGEVIFDLHAEPEGAADGFAESFERGRDVGRHGSYIAPFAGIHGWFWENRGMTPVTVELTASGFFTCAIEFRDGYRDRRVPGS